MQKKWTLIALIVLAGIVVDSFNDISAQDFKIRGRLHMDAFYGLNNAENFSNGFNNRRARLGMSGKITEGWDGIIEIDFAEGGVVPNDLFLRKTWSNGGSLKIGQFKVPQGINELTTSNNITFIERSSPSNSLTDSRRIGIGYDFFGGNYGLSGMFYGRSISQRGSVVGDMPIGIAFRGYYNPSVNIGLIHVGASVAMEDFNENNTQRYSDRPESRDSKGGSVRFLDATVNQAKSSFKSGLELLWINGSYHVESEFFLAGINQIAGDNLVFRGFALQAGYILTGESRSYAKGLPGSISPSNSSGAWELALRYSCTDLNDALFYGGVQNNVTMGVNYYVTSKLRFMGNLIYVTTDRTDANPLILSLRAQFNF